MKKRVFYAIKNKNKRGKAIRSDDVHLVEEQIDWSERRLEVQELAQVCVVLS